MKQQRFSTEQIVSVLKQAELGRPVAGLIRQIGISEQTFYRCMAASARSCNVPALTPPPGKWPAITPPLVY